MAESLHTVDQTVVLVDREVDLARHAVRKLLGDVRCKHRANVRKGKLLWAEREAEKFDATLDLYERLGGDTDEVEDLDEPGQVRRG